MSDRSAKAVFIKERVPNTMSPATVQIEIQTHSLGDSKQPASHRLSAQSNICLTLRLILFLSIHPTHSCHSLPGHCCIQVGHVPSSIFGTLCHAYLLSPLIRTASPLRSLKVATLAGSPGSAPSSPITKMPSQPREIDASGWSHSSLTSRCSESVSPGE